MLRRYTRPAVSAAARPFSAAPAADGVASTSAAPSTGATAESLSAKKRSGGNTLGKQLLSLVYAKRSAIVTIRQWKEKGNQVRKYELNRIVRELRKLRRYKHALEICEWMTLEQDIKLLPGDYAVHLDLIAKVRGLNSAEKFFEDMPAEMRGQLTCSALLHCYAQNKLSEKAEALVEKMKECDMLKDPLPFNHMLSLYIACGQLEKVPSAIEELKKNTKPDAVTYNLWLTVCSTNNDVETAEKVFLELKKARVIPDWVTYSILTNLYVKKGLSEKAGTTLKEMEKRISRKTRVAYSSLISLYTNMGDKDGARRIWRKMKSCFRKMNDAEYTCMISSLVKLGEIEEAEKFYTEWESGSNTGDPRVANLLIAAYINNNQIEKAETFCDRAIQMGVDPCYTTWELFTWGSLKGDHMDKALEYLKKAIASVKEWKFDKKLIGKMLEKFEEQGNVEGVEELLAVIRKAGKLNAEVYNALLRTYAKAGKMPLIIAERMEKDGVHLNEETHELIKKTSNMCVSEASCRFS
ncbi:hypothetical protein CRG98_026403 [Punica granatum]|uniref:Pentatricopeptide repeat-containing protein At4g02820, mitochondrial n=1 Tax=Punica granatum TaxID=22663 RepID=A0A2I0JAC1_PUNGR|nr:hypothetical protein CRG98_026403 [Punica granatum]